MKKNKLQLPKAVDIFLKRLSREYKPDKVIVYGSFARGDIHEGSDLDLVIIKSDIPQNFLKRIDEILDFCDGTIVVEPLVYKQSELNKMLKEGNDFIRTVIKEGSVVYER